VARSPTKERDRTRGFVARLIAIVAVVAGMTVIGCGGAGTNAEGPSKADYIAKADAICTAEQSRREGLEHRVDELAPITADETHEVARLLRRASEDRKVEIRRLRALRPPVADARTPVSLFSFLAEESAGLEAWADAYDRRDSAGIRGFQAQIAEDSANASAIARHYGFQVCGDPGNGNPGNLTRIR
jgi:hypothetical protein